MRSPLARARFLCLPPFAHRYIVYFVSVYLSPDGLAEPATVIGNFVKCSVRHSVIVCFNIRIQDESLERQCLVRITAMQHIIQHYYGIFHLATPCNSNVAESSVQYGTGSEWIDAWLAGSLERCGASAWMLPRLLRTNSTKLASCVHDEHERAFACFVMMQDVYFYFGHYYYHDKLDNSKAGSRKQKILQANNRS